MDPITLTLIGIGVFLAGAAVYFWEDIEKWANSIIERLRPIAAKLYIIVKTAYKVLERLYTRDNSVWKVTEREVVYDELPEEIKKLERDKEFQIALSR